MKIEGLGTRVVKCRHFGWKPGMVCDDESMPFIVSECFPEDLLHLNRSVLHVDHPSNCIFLLDMIREALGERCDRLLLDWLGPELGWIVAAWDREGTLLTEDDEETYGSPTRAAVCALIALDEAEVTK